MKYKLSHVQVIALGYLLMILLGTGLLMLPVSSADGVSAPFRTAFFTATSSSCVTGLILRDTATGWSFFGQAVLLVLIQIGGLGFMTIATFMYHVTRRRMGLRQREIMLESINNSQINGILKLTGEIIALTALFEGTGALLLATRFIPLLGWKKGIWYSIFHAVSAFCNAGFDLMGFEEPFGSFVHHASDPVLTLTLSALIVNGGLGFLVWHDVRVCGFRWKKYSVHTKLVLATSLLLLFGGAAVFLLTERDATGSGLSPAGRVLTAFFASVTARTAGFNTVDIASMSGGSKLLTILLMVVGGSPGSTAGGVKTSTVAVIALTTFAGFRGKKRPVLFGRSISNSTYQKSCNILFFNGSIALLAALVISATQPLDLVDILFESFSAIGTVGMTAGITRALTPFNSYLIALLMYMGRVGSVSFAVALLEKKAAPPVQYPEAQITVG